MSIGHNFPLDTNWENPTLLAGTADRAIKEDFSLTDTTNMAAKLIRLFGSHRWEAYGQP